MTENQFTEDQAIDKKIEDIIQRVQEAQTDNFFELAKILGRDPKKDYAGANFHQCDLSNGDLKGAILRQSNLSHANLSGTDLSGADLSGAVLSGADLSNAKLERAIVVGTLFDNNLGLSSADENYLQKRGAIFRNSQLKSNAQLENAQLEEVIVVDTLFNKNVGLNSADENYLQKRGAIFRNSQLKSNATISKSYKLKYFNEPSFRGFLQYFFGGENDFSTNIYELAPIELVGDEETTEERVEDEQTTEFSVSTSKESSINFITKLFSWCLAISFLIAFSAILYQALILGSERANIVIYHAFTLILGCFIGALTTYLRMASEQKN